ncbi:GPI-anchor transamidase [Diplonema papillatum]|nr:GPI-anchor transamidase [Diplonema papillatum]
MHATLSWLTVAACLLSSVHVALAAPAGAEERVKESFQKHTNNWAVLVDTSRFWANYRHAANVLTMYHLVKKLGIPDSNIVLMLGDDIPCNIRNAYPATLYNNVDHNINLYGDHVEADYRGYDVTVDNFLRVLTGRHDPLLPTNKRLDSDEDSNVLIFLSGHGGDKFLKFQDATEVTSEDLIQSLWQMRLRRRFRSVLLIVETCQAATLIADIKVPGVIAIGSALKGENAYSHHADMEVGVHVIDRFTYYTLQMLDHITPASTMSLQSLFNRYDHRLLHSHVQYISTHPLPLDKVLVTDYFASQAKLSPLLSSGTVPASRPFNTTFPAPPAAGAPPATLWSQMADAGETLVRAMGQYRYSGRVAASCALVLLAAAASFA